ncbi:ATP-binding protein [Amycolatopsis sp. NPDC049688]|uniref:ATP/GTP-binding protein n=1 Tax=Amycolatopsis sp. NPDC049688 TaxID=3154733 RepID=UPI00343FBE30
MAGRRAVKVLLSGSFSTGKTTTLDSLKAALERRQVRAVVTVDPARRCPLPLDLHQTADTAHWLLGDLLVQESEAAAQADIDVVLCDGGPPDILTHTPVHDSTLLALARAWQKTYDLVFWARPDGARSIAADDLRVLDEAYRQRIDDALPAAFAALGVIAYELPHDSSDRVDVMLEKLGVRS